MGEQENLQVIREAYEAYNAHDVERFVTMLDEGIVVESDSIPASASDREGVRHIVQETLTAFPDIHFNIEQMIASGDYVVVRLRLRGTHRGELQGVQPTNRPVDLRSCVVYEVKKGKVVGAQVYWDRVALLQQLGKLPSE